MPQNTAPTGTMTCVWYGLQSCVALTVVMNVVVPREVLSAFLNVSQNCVLPLVIAGLIDPSRLIDLARTLNLFGGLF